ncbi:MFS transporter [Phytohabitans houttuyneae]|uniref:MFS transporter n=1 Tax=Phytohabitans houttuyneae TaxID=1076126 RepID=A0A6V8KMN9_9ACTN|nr:MFS transporter [Phytohabitans houttuyneae]GFJ83226.1 MFS transporter [Phytohabitans houttuyneae]
MTVRNLSKDTRILAILVTAAVLIWLDATILGVALERLADPAAGLGAGPGELQWAVGSYSLIFATGLFAAGALGDRYGHRTVLVAGLAAFGVASVWAAWAGSPTQLIVARGLMGAGGAMIMPSSMAIIGVTFPPQRRAGAIAAWSASSGVGVAGGPLIGGLLIDHFWWGAVFLVNVPVVALALAGVLAAVPNPKAASRRRVDVPGLVLSTAGLVGLAYGLIEGGQSADWGQARVWAPIAAGVVLLVAFVVAELRAAQPSFDPRLFRNPRFAAGNLALGALFFGVTGQMFFGTFYLQGARGMSAWDAGLVALPGALGVIAGAPLGTHLARRLGVAVVAGAGLAAVAVAFAANLAFGLHTSLFWWCVAGGLSGLGLGAAVAPVTAAVVAALPPERMGAGSAVTSTIRQVGSVLGIAVLGTILTTSYRGGVGPALAGLPEGVRDSAGSSAEATRHAAGVLGRPELADAANRAFVDAMHVTASWAGVVVLGGAAAVLIAFRSRRRPVTESEHAPAKVAVR